MPTTSATEGLGLIPRPAHLSRGDGTFELTAECVLTATSGDAEALFAAEYLAARLRAATRFPLPIEPAGSDAAGKAIRLERHGGNGEAGAYTLRVDEAGVTLRSPGGQGLFHGVQTIRQLLPAAVEAGCPAASGTPWLLPHVEIADQPRYKWRGFMHDPARHFLSIEFTKRTLDLLAYYKFNRFHWHLTDDQGWRIESKRFPRLHQVGSRGWEGPQRQGYYTQSEVREIVRYAAERHLEVIPEIDVPGHSFAAMSSYPELCCTGKPVRNRGHQRDLYCAGREETFAFLRQVLEEVTELFPAPYVHIGGDEAPKDRWRECPHCQERIRAEGLAGEEELQGYFTNRLAEILAALGRRLIGWEEILDHNQGLRQDAILHWWRHRTHGAQNALRAVELGHEVIASPNSFTYLCFPTTPDDHWREARTSDLPKVYGADLTPAEMPPDKRHLLLGGEACMWGDTDLQEELDAKMFPRLLALAELLWSPAGGKDFDEFLARARRHYAVLDALGVQYGPEFRDTGS